MSRNYGPAFLQKTYDDSYLRCSTAVYYESQGNEAEAMRCWKHALDQIYNHTGQALSSRVPKSETEKALVDSLRQLELQCKERIDLLEALRISRQVDPTQHSSSLSSGRVTTQSEPLDLTPSHDKGWIGQGTIPAVTYPELSRPALPHRPSLPNRTSSERAVVGSSNSNLDLGTTSPLPALSSSPLAGERKERSLRANSPEKHTMRTTLRSTKPGEKSAKLTRRGAAKPEGPGASKAATLAWSALSSKDRGLRGLGPESQASPSRLSPNPSSEQLRKPTTPSGMLWDTHTRRLVTPKESDTTASSEQPGNIRHSDEYPFPRPSPLSISAASSALSGLSAQDLPSADTTQKIDGASQRRHVPLSVPPSRTSRYDRPSDLDLEDSSERRKSTSDASLRRKPVGDALAQSSGNTASGYKPDKQPRSVRLERQNRKGYSSPGVSNDESKAATRTTDRRQKGKQKENAIIASPQEDPSEESNDEEDSPTKSVWQKTKSAILKNLPSGVDETAAKQILNEIVIQGDEVHWSDVAGLEIAKNALRETVIYPFLRPDLFMGLREPARGMLLFGPPGTGKTMLARAVATESRSTFFSISASSLTSKYLGESEKLVRALFALAKALAPSIIFVDEIDSLLSHRAGSGEHEATRRIKTEFLIQWSDLQRAAAGRETTDKDKDRGDPNRVLVLAATNLPWAIDEAARRRFVRRQYIPLPEPETRATQLRTLLGQQKHSLSDADISKLILLTEGFSGSDITALAKDAAMGPLRSLGEALLHMTMDQIRPIELGDFEASLTTIRPSVSKTGLKEYEDWAKEFGERGG